MTTPQFPRARARQRQSGQGQTGQGQTSRAKRGRAQPGRPRSGRSRQAVARSLPKGDAVFTPGASSARRAMEHSSARPLAFLYQLPRWLAPVALLALLIAGLSLSGWIGATALVLVAAILAWLAYVSWPALGGRGRLSRMAAIACVFAFAVVQALR